MANDTWYHVWLIKRADTGVVDALFSLSATAPTMPANYTRQPPRRFGPDQWVRQHHAFEQISDEFEWDVPASSM